MEIKQYQETAARVRVGIVKAVHSAGSGHPGGSLSAADIVTALYFKERKKVWFAKGLVLDVALSILFLPACFWFFTFFYGLIG